MTSVALILCSICVVILIVTYLINRYKAAKLPPLAPAALPFVGHNLFVLTLLYKNRLHESYVEILQDALNRSESALTFVIGISKIHIIIDPEFSYLLANTCLDKDDTFYRFFRPLFGSNGLINADVPVWKRHRKLLSPTFNKNVLNTFLVEFNDQASKLVKNLLQEAGKGLFDPLPYMKHMQLCLVCATLMGVHVDQENLIVEAGKSIETFLMSVMDRFTNVWYHNDFLYNFSNQKKQRDVAVKSLLNFTKEILKKRKQELYANKHNKDESSNPRFKSLLSLLLELPEENALTESEIIDQVITFIAAAYDTTYHTLGNLLLTLGSYPEVQKKVFEEIQEVLEGNDVDKDNLSKLKYLEAVINESMRLYPTVYFFGRVLNKDLNFKNYTLPAGSQCYTSIYHVCRHPVWGPDAGQFRPERWLDGSLPSNVAKAYAVFGLGKRSCIGSNYAMMVMKTILSHVVREYRISSDVTRLVQRIGIVITPVSGHHISIEKR